MECYKTRILVLEIQIVLINKSYSIDATIYQYHDSANFKYILKICYQAIYYCKFMIEYFMCTVVSRVTY